MQNTDPELCGTEETTECSSTFLKNIENRVAWFLAELCKAGKGVQRHKGGHGGTPNLLPVAASTAEKNTRGGIAAPPLPPTAANVDKKISRGGIAAPW
jgi:hypothetical protein